jgi:hypothetical protein
MTLAGRGRDTEDIDLAIEWVDASCRWSIRGTAAEVLRSDERGRILLALQEAGAAGLKPAELAVDAGISPASARQTLRRMAKAGEIKKLQYGRYCHPSVTPVTPVTPVTVEENGEFPAL